MFDAGIVNGDLIYSIDGIPTASMDSLNAIMERHKVGDVVQVDVEQRNMRRVVPMKLRGRREMKVSTYESLGLPVTEQMREFRKSWLESRRAGKL